MAYPISPALIGVDVTAAPVFSPAFAVGTRVRMNDGTEWAYLGVATSTTAIRQYDVCIALTSVTAKAVTSTTGLQGGPLCIAQQAVALDATNVQYLWFLIANPSAISTWKVRVALSAAIDAKLATTAFAGTLDDTTAGTVLRVDGIVLTDSQPAGSSGSRTFRTSFFPLTWGAV